MFKNRIIINISSNWGNFLILTIVQFLVTPFLIHKLGDEEYGIWILIVSVVGYMELLKLGMNTGITRYISKFFEVDDNEKANEIFNTALAIFLSLAFLLLFLVLILSHYFPYFFSLKGNYLYKIIFLIVGISLVFEFIFLTFSAALSAMQKFLEINVIATSIFLVRTFLIVAFLMAGYKLLALAIIQICTNILRGILLSIYLFKTTPQLSFAFASIRKDSVKMIFNYTLYNFLMNIAAKVNLTGSIVLVGYFLSAGAVTFYSIANNLIGYLHTLIMEMQRVLIPRFSQLEAQNHNEKIREMFLSFTRYTLIIGIPIIFIYIFYGDSFIALWVGNKYAVLSGKVLAILAIGKLFHISQVTIETALKGISKHRNLAFLKIMESISVLILCVLLVKKYDIIGIAYANAIPMVFFNFIVIPVYACNLLGISIPRYYFHYIFRNVFAVFPLFIICSFLNYPVTSYPHFLILSLSISMISLLFSFAFILDLKERKLIYPLFKIKI